MKSKSWMLSEECCFWKPFSEFVSPTIALCWKNSYCLSFHYRVDILLLQDWRYNDHRTDQCFNLIASVHESFFPVCTYFLENSEIACWKLSGGYPINDNERDNQCDMRLIEESHSRKSCVNARIESESKRRYISQAIKQTSQSTDWPASIESTHGIHDDLLEPPSHSF